MDAYKKRNDGGNSGTQRNNVGKLGEQCNFIEAFLLNSIRNYTYHAFGDSRFLCSEQQFLLFLSPILISIKFHL